MTGQSAGQRRALLIRNLHSRRGRDSLESAFASLRAGGLDLTVVVCAAPSDISPLIETRASDFDCVIVAGGDGTLNAAALGLFRTKLPLGILPLGTANDLARTLGLPIDATAAATIIGYGRRRQIDLGIVNGHGFFNVASVGLSAELARRLTPQLKRRFGRLGYGLAALDALANARPFHAKLVTPTETVDIKTLQIAIGNGRYYGGGNAVAHDAVIDDGDLALYSLEFSKVWRMALMLRTFKSGEHGIFSEVRTARGKKFEVHTRRSRPVNADGELVTTTPAHFSLHHGAVSVYVPDAGPD